MSEKNLAVVQEMWEACNAHDAGRSLPLYNEKGYVWEDDVFSTPIRSFRAAVETMEMHWNVFPDARYEIENMMASGDYVITQVRVTGTHRGDIMGLPATHRKVEIHGCTVHELKNEKITREWSYWDSGRVLRQLGVLPDPGEAASGS